MTNSPAQVFAAELMANFAALGRTVWLAPGARSQALAIASAQLAGSGHLRLHVRLDERTLGFSALGAAVFGGPQVVITTSGTAVANLHPAVLEAHHSGLPLILLTADRPAEIRGKGSNQTTNQVGIFADAAHCTDVPAPMAGVDLAQLASELAHEAVLMANSGKVVQLNLQFREPLSASSPDAVAVLGRLKREHPSEVISEEHKELYDLDLTLPTVVVAGANCVDFEAEVMALGLPVLAEPSSGLRHLTNAVLGYRFILDGNHDIVNEVRQVVVFGKPTLSRSVIALLKRADVRVLVRKSRMGHFAIGSDITQIDEPVSGNGSPVWLQRWKDVADSLVPISDGVFDRRAIIETIWREDATLVLGASQLIREADCYAPGNQVRVWANRGLSGIDGTIATATGLAIDSNQPVRVLLGDLTFFHDASSLMIDPEDGDHNIQLIVVNDNGGKIFSKLEVAQSVDQDIFRRVFATPQTANISGLARAYGWSYVEATDSQSLAESLNLSGRVVIEIKLS